MNPDMTPYVMLLGTDHLTCMGGYGFSFRSEKKFRTTRELEYFFPPEFNIRLHDKSSESDYIFFSSTKIRIFFSATLGIRIFFLEKTITPSGS